MENDNCRKRCDGCAFTEGSPANIEPHNHLKALICLSGPLPFQCHETFDWKDPSINKYDEGEIERRGMKICVGWREDVKKLAATGYYKASPKMNKIRAMIAQEFLNDFLIADADDYSAEEKEGARQRLERFVIIIGNKLRNFRK